MAISRLRLRLAASFALTFAIGLAVLVIGALGYLWRESHQRLDGRLNSIVQDAALNFGREFEESPDSSAKYVASEVVNEWPRTGGYFVIIDADGHTMAYSEHEKETTRIVEAWKRSRTAQFNVDSGGDDFRIASKHFRFTPEQPFKPVEIDVIAFASTEGIEEDTRLLTLALAIAAPLIVLASMVAGYFVAGRALRPVTDLGNTIAAIAPTDLSHRLTVADPLDEVGGLAVEFNAMLERLSEAQIRNRTFLREAAHQIRTPLTLVLGEAAHELAAADSPEQRMRESLTRIRTAAEQMRRRVDELFLLAEAQAGEPVTLDNKVELDGLVLECADLMRSRATALGRTLAIGRADHVVTIGNAALLQEGMLELLENALRHGDASHPVTASVTAHGSQATLAVESAGEPFVLPTNDSHGPDGLGLPIVRWVAQVHHGELSVEHTHGRNAVRITIPITA